MAYNKKQAKEIVKGLERTHPSFFRLAAYVPFSGNMEKLTHFPQTFVAVRHKNLSDVLHAFRQKFPFGQYLLIVVCGDDTPENPPSSNPLKQKLAKLRGKYTPAVPAEVLKLDTNWLDKAFEYQKRTEY